MKTYAIVGAGGFGREVMPLALTALADEIAGGRARLVFVSENAGEHDTINGIKLISMGEFVAIYGEKLFNIAIANSMARERISRMLESIGAVPFTITACNSMNLSTNEIGPGAILCPFTIITSNAKIGRFFHANINSYVAHDCVIGDYVTFAPAVMCNGNVVVESHAYIGTGAIIREGKPGQPVIIGEAAVVGMGSVVTRSVPPGVTVVGNPARTMET